MSKGFSDYEVVVGSAHIDPSPRAAKEYLRSTLGKLKQLHYRSTEWWMLNAQERRIEDAILGRPGTVPANLLAANLAARYALGAYGIDLFDYHRHTNPDRRYCLVTLFSDRWLTFDRDLNVWLGGLKAASRPVLALGQFHGWLAVAEYQTLVETRAGFGRLVLPNVHAVAWSDDPQFSFEASEYRMSASKRLTSQVSAQTAKVSYREDTSPTNLVAYMLKGASVGKYRTPSRSSPSGFVLDDCALPPRAAARQTEMLSAVDLDELIFAGGQGTAIRRELLHHLEGLLQRRVNAELSKEAATRFWNRTRPRTEARYGPVSVIRTPQQLPTYAPISMLLDRSVRDAVAQLSVVKLS